MKQKKQTTTTKAAPSQKKLSLNEFRAWLSGVEEMQPDNWTPDPTQWRRIRQKIEDVIDNPRSFNSDDGGSSAELRYPPRWDGQPASWGPPPAMVPPVSGLVPGAAPVPMAPTTPLFASPKTPDIDTSKGGYASSLE